MVGEVWLASGQSNMSMPLKGWPPSDPIKDAELEIANAEYPDIRMFKVANKYSLSEEKSFEGEWNVCTPRKAADFSATAYFFARRLYQELKVPIGIINSSWGGTPAEAWTSKAAIGDLGDFDELIKAIRDPENHRKTKEWFSQFQKVIVPENPDSWNELSLLNDSIAQPDYQIDNWSTMQLPGRVDLYNEVDVDGVFWMRRTIDLKNISLPYNFEMGITDDTDVVYFNGTKVGATAYDFTNARSYAIPKSLLKEGSNTIAIRLIDTGGPGSISTELKLTNDNAEEISLAGEWEYCITGEIYESNIYQYNLAEVSMENRPIVISPKPYSTPSILYNAMIHPLVPFKFKGTIWYQGESNVGRAEQYKRLFPSMITDWRTQWNSNFPFYFVQIAPYAYNTSGDPEKDDSQKLRDAQRSSLSLDNTGMVVTLDIGNNANIHPANKQDVGGRLAGLALANDYGKAIVASGPLYRNHKIKRESIFVEFDFIGSGLIANSSMILGFEIAGMDKKFISAEAVIVGDKVKVSADGISKPMYVRYAWRDTSVASLFNKEGLPVSSFTTDN